MRKHLMAVCGVVALLVSISCRFFVPGPTPTTPPSESPSTPTPVVNTVPPEITETPVTPTDTPAPVGLNPRGPYILYQSNGIWISNPDGSFLTQLTTLTRDHRLDLHRAISPQGDSLVMVVFGDSGLDLVQVAIPSGKTKTLTHLLDLQQDELLQHPTSAKAFTAYAILDYDSFAWQPGSGQLLAFMGAINGPTSDLYLYDTQTGKISQLTNGPSQAVEPNWSPDGQYIWHYGGSWVPPFGGAIGPYTRLDGIWAVRVSDGEVITEPKPKGLLANFVGWQDNTHYITYDSDEECFSKNLRSVDILSGKAEPLMDFSFYYQIARSPENRAFLFAGAAGCPTSPGEGVFLLPDGQTTPIKLLDKRAYQVEWLPESRVFQAYPEALFSSDGKTRYDPPVYDKSYEQAISRQGYQAWEVIENQKGRVVVNIGDGNWQKIIDGLVDQLIWDPISGKTLLIGLKDGSLYAASFPDFTPRKMGETGGGFTQAVWSS
jgi:hypothetical protein